MPITREEARKVAEFSKLAEVEDAWQGGHFRAADDTQYTKQYAGAACAFTERSLGKKF